MHEYKTNVKQAGRHILWRNADVDKPNEIKLILIINNPSDAVINLFVQMLSGKKKINDDFGHILPGQAVTVDLYNCMTVSATTNKDATINCSLSVYC